MLKEIIIDNGTAIRHYSDEGFYIRQEETQVLYEDAIDSMPCKYTYTETDIKIEGEGEEATEQDYQNALTELGVDMT